MLVQYLREELERQRTIISRDGTTANTHRSTSNNNQDHLRRLIQSAYVCFQQLNECDDLNDDQRHWIHNWLEAVSNVRFHRFAFGSFEFRFSMFFQENSEEIFNKVLTSRVIHLENALHTVRSI